MNNFANVLPMRVTLRLLGLPEEDLVKRWADCTLSLESIILNETLTHTNKQQVV